MAKQLIVNGQLGDQAVVEVGRGSLYIGGKNADGEFTTAAMLTPEQARQFADCIRVAAHECETQ